MFLQRFRIHISILALLSMWLAPPSTAAPDPAPCAGRPDLILNGAGAFDPSVQAWADFRALACLHGVQSDARRRMKSTTSLDNNLLISHTISLGYTSAFIRTSEPYVPGESAQADFIDAHGPLYEGAGSFAISSNRRTTPRFGLGTAPAVQLTPTTQGSLRRDIHVPLVFWIERRRHGALIAAPILLYGAAAEGSFRSTRWAPGFTLIIPKRLPRALWAMRLGLATSSAEASYEGPDGTVQTLKATPREEGALRLEAVHLKRLAGFPGEWLISIGGFTNRQKAFTVLDDQLESSNVLQTMLRTRSAFRAHPASWIDLGLDAHGGAARIRRLDTNEASSQYSIGINTWLGIRMGAFRILGVLDLRRSVGADPAGEWFEYQAQAKWGLFVAFDPPIHARHVSGADRPM